MARTELLAEPGAECIAGLRATFRATRAVLRDREAELLTAKGPCSNSRCRLHYAHGGPCDQQQKGKQ